MSDAFTRRDFLGTAALVVAGGTPRAAAAPAGARIWMPRARKFAAVASANGIRGVKLAVDLMQQGADTLDAAIEGVKLQELDPTDESVGYGGHPNEEGVVQLDASCMHGPSRRAGAVAALEGIKTPSEIARLVLKYTNHVLLVGEGAKRFALSYGYKEEELLTPSSREQWLRWRANRGHEDDWTDIPEGTALLTHRPTGTVNLNAVNAKGEISSVTTTSGTAYKIPGRVGDSPIPGAGEYCDNDIGAAGSTGEGERNIIACGGFLTVEHLRRGMRPTDACLETLKRVLALTPASRLNAAGRPRYQIQFYAINQRGEYGCAGMYPTKYAACDDVNGPRELDGAAMFEKQ